MPECSLWRHLNGVFLRDVLYVPMAGMLNHCPYSLTHWGRDKMAADSQTTLSNPFSWMKILWFRFRFQWSLFLRVQLTIIQHWFRLWLGAGQATSHYLNQWWLILLTHICVTRPQWVKVIMNQLWLSLTPQFDRARFIIPVYLYHNMSHPK